jgi:hypothetical protein
MVLQTSATGHMVLPSEPPTTRMSVVSTMLALLLVDDPTWRASLFLDDSHRCVTDEGKAALPMMKVG